MSSACHARRACGAGTVRRAACGEGDRGDDMRRRRRHDRGGGAGDQGFLRRLPLAACKGPRERQADRGLARLRRGPFGRGRLLGVPEQPHGTFHAHGRPGVRELGHVHAVLRHGHAARGVLRDRHGHAVFAVGGGDGPGRRLQDARPLRQVHGRPVRGHLRRVPLPRRRGRRLFRHRARLPRLPARTRRVPSDHEARQGPAAARLRRAPPRGASSRSSRPSAARSVSRPASGTSRTSATRSLGTRRSATAT